MKFFLCAFGILWNIWSSTKWSNNLCIISCDCETVHISKCIVSGLQQPTKPLATVLISYHPSPNSLDLLLQIRIHAFCRSRCMLFANFFFTDTRAWCFSVFVLLVRLWQKLHMVSNQKTESFYSFAVPEIRSIFILENWQTRKDC